MSATLTIKKVEEDKKGCMGTIGMPMILGGIMLVFAFKKGKKNV